MRWISSAITVVALAVAFLLIPVPVVLDNAFASKMSGSYGCSEGPGRCHGNESNRSFTTGAKKAGIKAVYDQNYPPSTTDFSSLIRAIRAAKPEMVFVMSYPNDSVAIVRAVNEIGVGSQVQIFGGGMVGLQFTPNMVNLGSSLNGILNYNSYVPGMKYPGIEDFLARYAKRAAEAKVDPLGFYLPPFNYAIGQIYEQAIAATRTLDHKKLAAWLHANEVKTIVGSIRWDKNGEWANPRVVQAQFRGVVDGNLDQWRSPGKQVVIYPEEYKTGDVMTPFEKARSSK